MPDKPISVICFRPGGRSVYYAQWVDPETGKKRTKSTGTSINRDAERFAGKLQDELNNGAIVGKRTTWKEFRTRAERDFLPEKRENTQEKYRSVLNVVQDALKPNLLTGINADAIGDLKAKLRAKGNAEATVAAHLRHLKALLRWGQRQGLLRAVPHIEIPSLETSARGRPITGEEFERLLLAVPKIVGEERAESWYYLLRGLYLGGLRIGEACKLTWDDPEGIRVELERKHPLLFIPASLQKGKRDTVTAITPDFAELLREMPSERRTGFVFKPEASGPTRGDGLGQQQVEKTIRAIGKKAGIITKRHPVEYVSAHDLRRSFCFRWAQKILPQHLRALARHRSIETTLKYYAEADADQTAEAVWTALANISANTPSSTEGVNLT